MDKDVSKGGKKDQVLTSLWNFLLTCKNIKKVFEYISDRLFELLFYPPPPPKITPCPKQNSGCSLGHGDT